MNHSNGDYQYCPKKEYLDYIEIVYLIVMFVVGGIFNLKVYQSIKDKTPHFMVLPSSFRRLQWHLNITDLMIIFIVIPCTLCELFTGGVWRAGEVICKVVKFSDVFCWQMSSNILVLIAFNRIINRKHTSSRRSGTIFVVVAWLVAVILAIPQLVFWEIDDRDIGAPKCFNRIIQETENPDIVMRKLFMAYTYVHMMAISYIPLVLLIISYALLMSTLYQIDLFRGCKKKTALAETEVSLVPSENDGSSSVRLTNGCVHNYNAMSSLTPTSRNAIPLSERHCEDPNRIVHFDDAVRRGTYAHLNERSPECQTRRTKLKAAQKKALRCTLMLILAYLVCWLPYNILAVLHIEATCGIMGMTQLIVFHSVLNPFLYGIKSQYCCC